MSAPAWLVAALLAGMAAGFAGGWQVQAWRHGRLAAEQAAQVASVREEAMHAALIETTRRLTAQQEAADAATRQARRARVDAAAAADAAGRLRAQAIELAASAARCDSAPAGDGAADRLARVLGESVERYREVAAAADRAIIAGSECAGRYEALSQ